MNILRGDHIYLRNILKGNASVDSVCVFVIQKGRRTRGLPPSLLFPTSPPPYLRSSLPPLPNSLAPSYSLLLPPSPLSLT